jgi:hypothetical protein
MMVDFHKRSESINVAAGNGYVFPTRSAPVDG